MNAWVAADAPVRRSPGAVWSLERQVRLVAGGIVASSVLAKLPWNRSSAADIDADIDAAVARLRG
jgi:hypothetical protein